MKPIRVFGLLALLVCCAGIAHAQDGIPSDGNDFYLAYIHPTLDCSNTGPFQSACILVGAYYDTHVSVYYFKSDGTEFEAATYDIPAMSYRQIPIDTAFMMSKNPLGGVPEYRTCHIHASSPVSCSFYSTGPGDGGMYLALPTSALGKHYSVVTLNANPGLGHNNSWYGCNIDSTSSEAAIVAIDDSTKVTIIPNATTMDGKHLGVNSGKGAIGIAYPFTVVLQRGQVYFLKSGKDSAQYDMSGSIIDADKPIGVVAANGNAFNGETQFASRGGDQRDVTMEMMIPVEYWTSKGYMSMPMMDSPGTPNDDPSGGDMYRIITYDPRTTNVDYWSDCNGHDTLQTSRFLLPPTTINNVVCGVNIGSQTDQKIFVEQFDYRLMSNAEPYPAPSQMNVVPQARWRNSYMWAVPDDKNQVHKRRYINLIGYASQIPSIKIWVNGKGPKPITSLPSVGGPCNIPNTGGQIVGRRFEIIPGTYYATDDSAFALYQYGLLGLDPDFDLGDNDGDDFYFEYAAPAGELFSIDNVASSQSEPATPKIKVDASCAQWTVHIRDTAKSDGGIVLAEILNDPMGVQKRRPGSDSGYVSTNVVSNPTNYAVAPGDTVVDAVFKTVNSLLDADAWIWVMNAAGRDTVVHLTYKAPQLEFGRDYAASGTDTAAFMRLPLNQDSCVNFVLKNTGDSGSLEYTLENVDFLHNGMGVYTIAGTVPSLPAALAPGDSVVIGVCFKTSVVGTIFLDTLQAITNCPKVTASLIGCSSYPLLYATDRNFNIVRIGSLDTNTVNLKNVGTADLVLTKDWSIPSGTYFGFLDSTLLPLTLRPGASVNLRVTYNPQHYGGSTTTIQWGTNLVKPFEHAEKDYSRLWGFGMEHGLNWDRSDEGVTTSCETPVQDTIRLLKLVDTNQSQEDMIDSVVIHGSTGSEWKILRTQLGAGSVTNHPMKQNDSLWFLIEFSPNLAKPDSERFLDRVDTLIAYDADRDSPPLILHAQVNHAELVPSQASVNFGTASAAGVRATRTITVRNPGTAPLILMSVGLDSASSFTIIAPSLGIGDTIMPGDSATITVQATSTNLGTSRGQLTLVGTTPCTLPLAIPLEYSSRFVAVQGSSLDYDSVYLCRDNTLSATVQSTGSDTVLLVSAELIDDPAYPGGSNDYAFSDGSKLLTLNKVLPRDSIYTIPVLFSPTAAQQLNAQIRYTFDTARNPGIATWQSVQPILGAGLQEHETLTAAKVDGSADHYTSTTNDVFEVPIRFTETMRARADAASLTFDFTYRRDLFQWVDPPVDMPGYTVTNVGAPVVNGSLETRSITVQPTSGTFTSLADLLHVKLHLMVARDTNSDFTISNVLFRDRNGNPICYIVHKEIAGAFTPLDLCGNDIIRHYMLTGQLSYSVEEVGPNPATNTINVTLDVAKDKTPISIELFDGVGNRVYSSSKVMAAGTNSRVINVSNLSSGDYTIRFSSATGEVLSRKLVIQK